MYYLAHHQSNHLTEIRDRDAKQWLKEQIERFQKPIAVTLTFHVRNGEEPCRKAWLRIMNGTNRCLFKNDYRRRGKQLEAYAVVACHCIDAVKRWHIHAVIGCPEEIAQPELERVLIEEFQKIPGSMTHKLKDRYWNEERHEWCQVDAGWIEYMCDQRKPIGMSVIDSII